MNRKTIFTLLLAGTTALWPVQAFAMPQAIAALIIPLITTAGTVGAIGFTGVAYAALAVGYGITAAALYGLSALFTPDVPKAPKPEDGKYNLKQAVPSLAYCLGRNKKGGDYTFLEEKDGTAYHITVVAGHRIHGFVEHWLHDEKVTLHPEGWVQDPRHFVGDGTPPAAGADHNVRILTRTGLAAETAYADVVAAFPGIWTEDHRGDGLASVRMSASTVSMEDYQKVYPQQMPQHVPVFDGLEEVYDPRTDTYGYTTNLAQFRLWHLTHPVGGKLTIDDMYLPEWETAAEVGDENVTNRDGGTEGRYQGGLWFRADNDPVQIGMLMDQAAELVVYERPDGTVGVHPGKYVAPDVRLTDRDIIAVSFDANRRKSSNVLAVRGRYTSPEAGFVTVDAAIYGNPYTGESTERTRTVENQAVQSHNHMARLQKITYTRANAPRVNILAHYSAAKNAPYRRFVRIHMPPRMDEAVIELTGRPKLSLRNLTVEFSGIVVPPTLYDFDAATEEGAPGASVTPVEPTGVPEPVNFDVVIQNEVVSGGATAAYALASWDHVSDALVYELEWQPSAVGDRLTALSKSGDTSVRSGYLADGVEYSFRLRTWSAGISSEFTDPVLRTATADPVSPGVVTGASLTGGAGQVTFAWISPNSANYFAARLYLNTVDDFATATLAATEYGAPNEPDNRAVTSISAGTYFGWAVAINASGTAAAAVSTGASVSVT